MNKLQFILFMAVKMPIAFIAGIRLQSISQQEAQIRVRHHWFSQNPFRSIYFAVQAMAAEISTGILVMQSIRESHKNCSMLVVEQTAKFHKKATGKIIFSCSGGPTIAQTLSQLQQKGDSNTLVLQSVGRNVHGEIVSEFNFTWSLKLK